jgi:nardilysin
MSLQNEVQEGPDLNASRNPFDKKEYRHILLPNGLRALLVSDTVAMAQDQPSAMDDGSDCDSKQSGAEEEDEPEDDGYDEEVEDEQDEDEFGEEESKAAGGGIRGAAAAMIVGVGSMYDPPEVQGLSHFLEHLLFMGSKYVCCLLGLLLLENAT